MAAVLKFAITYVKGVKLASKRLKHIIAGKPVLRLMFFIGLKF